MKKRKLRLSLADALERLAGKLRKQVSKEEAYRRGKKNAKQGRDGLLTFLTVEFSDGGCAYSYLAAEDIFCVGDRVNAPVGEYGHMLHGTVTEVLHLPPEQAPYPLDKIKTIEEIVRRAEKRVQSEEYDEENRIDYACFQRQLEAGKGVGEVCFYFCDDDWKEERYIGYKPGENEPYWAGYCDVEDGCEFASAQQLLQAKIFDGRSLEERWEYVRFHDLDGLSAQQWRNSYGEDS